MPDAFAAAEAAVAAVVGDDAPFPHFDERQGHLPGPDRQATRSVPLDMPPPRRRAWVEAIKTTERWTYARAMVLEALVRILKDGVIVGGRSRHCVHPSWRRAAARPSARRIRTPSPRRVLPFLVRGCAHTGHVVGLAPVIEPRASP